jgi:hypothetical protein
MNLSNSENIEFKTVADILNTDLLKECKALEIFSK